MDPEARVQLAQVASVGELASYHPAQYKTASTSVVFKIDYTVFGDGERVHRHAEWSKDLRRLL